MFPFPRLLKYGNTGPTKEVIFQLSNFSTVQDIKDTGRYGVTVTNTGITVGADSNGSYMVFNGVSGNCLEFSDARLASSNNYEVEMLMSNFAYRQTTYANPIFDTRPMGTNGNYWYLYYTSNTPAPFKVTLGSNNDTSTITTPGISQYPVKIVFRVVNNITTLYINDVLQPTTIPGVPFSGLTCKIGKNAFVGSAPVPYLQCNMYYFRINRLLFP